MANGFRTGALDVRIGQDSLGVDISDRQDHFIQRDPANAVSFDGDRFTLRKIMPSSEQYYGLGDKTGPFNRRGASYVNWTTDAWGFDRGTDPIYKSIPFYIASGGAGGAYGLFLDNTLAKRVRFRPSRRKHARDLGRRRADRLLHHRRPDRRRRRPPLHGPDRQGAAAASLGTGLPAVALQLHERDRGPRPGGPTALGADPDRRHLARHRLPGPQPPVHDQSEDVSRPQGPCPRCRQAGHQAGDDHRPARRARAEPGLRAVRQRDCRRSLPQELRTAAFTSRRSGRGRRSFPTSPARRAATGGAASTSPSSTTASPASGST